jgi:hypothetical protein
MRILNRKTPLQRFLDSVNDTLDVPDGFRFDLPGGGPGKALKAGLIAAGGLAGLTAGSAGISSLRRHKEGERDDS